MTLSHSSRSLFGAEQSNSDEVIDLSTTTSCASMALGAVPGSKRIPPKPLKRIDLRYPPLTLRFFLITQ